MRRHTSADSVGSSLQSLISWVYSFVLPEASAPARQMNIPKKSTIVTRNQLSPPKYATHITTATLGACIGIIGGTFTIHSVYIVHPYPGRIAWVEFCRFVRLGWDGISRFFGITCVRIFRFVGFACEGYYRFGGLANRSSANTAKLK